jgi:hypothetical protein
MAAQQAARCQSFLANMSTTQLSAVNTAKAILSNGTSQAGGKAIVSYYRIYIEQCPLGQGTCTTPGNETPLASPADPTQNSYSCEVWAMCTFQPMFTGPIGLLGSVPGLNAPYNIVVKEDCVFEGTQGLNQ